MEIALTSDQEAFVRAAVDTGRIARPGEAAAQAIALWEERERRREEILALVDEAEASLGRGEGVDLTPDA